MPDHKLPAPPAVFKILTTLIESAIVDQRTGLLTYDAWCLFSGLTSSSTALIVVDVDHLKTINDSHGHLAGDAVLADVAGVLTRSTRQEDLVGRFGGDEFLVLLAPGPVEPAEVAERIRRRVARLRVKASGVVLRVTVSIGVADFAGDRELAMKVADEALYSAKKSGRNRVAIAEPSL